MTKKCKVVVVMEQFTAGYLDDQMLLRIQGGGIASNREDALYESLTDIFGIDEVTVNRWHVGIQKEDGYEWFDAIPAIKKSLVKFFGRGVRFTKRTSRTMPERIGMRLDDFDDEFGEDGESEMDLIRETMRGCALTEDECDALGIDFHQHHVDLVNGDY